MKMPEMLAQVGGLLQFVKIIAVVLYTNYNQHFYFEDLFNNFFSYKLKSDKNPMLQKAPTFLNNSNNFKLIETTMKNNTLNNTEINQNKSNNQNKSDLEDNTVQRTEKHLPVEKTPTNQLSKYEVKF